MTRVACGFVLLLMIMFAGCTTTSTSPLLAAPVAPIIDVPIPAGFYLAGDSQTYQASSIRIAHHHYKGSDDYLSVARFFREQLPLKGWTLLSQQQNGQTVVLSFSKPAEDLVVTVTEGTFNTNVYVKLDPRTANPTLSTPQ